MKSLAAWFGAVAESSGEDRMKGALSFLVLSITLGFAAFLPASVIPKPYGIWLSIPLFFASIFASFGLTMRIAEGRLASLKDVTSALNDGKDLFFSWSIYMAAMTSIAGVISLLLKI
ncbi:hypothetical protein QEM13_002013 [Pseudomonas putida]|nr:hypothetical protein [Pseudomonas putida]